MKELIELIPQVSQETTTAKARFNIPMEQEDFERFLTVAYLKVVNKRGHNLSELDATTQTNIQKVAGWLISTNPNRKCGLFLMGRVGNGKTTMLKAIAEAIVLVKGAAAKFLTKYGWELVRDGNLIEEKRLDRLTLLETATIVTAQEYYGLSSDRRSDISSQRLVLLDDMGVESPTKTEYGNVSRPIADLISKRYDLQSPTIITTNLNDKEISERYGERIASRMQELFDVLVYEQGDYRKRK